MTDAPDERGLLPRRYTFEEVNQMRADIYALARPFSNPDRSEDELRTYILAGVDPEELHQRAVEKQAEEEAKWLRSWAQSYAEESAKRAGASKPAPTAAEMKMALSELRSRLAAMQPKSLKVHLSTLEDIDPLGR